MSVWVDDVGEMHKHCVPAGLEVTPICRGTSARCTFAIPMAMCSVSAGDSSRRSSSLSVVEQALTRFDHWSFRAIVISQQMKDQHRTGLPTCRNHQGKAHVLGVKSWVLAAHLMRADRLADC
jgi:hypothetical protein